MPDSPKPIEHNESTPEEKKRSQFLALARRYYLVYFRYVDYKGNQNNPESIIAEESLYEAQLAIANEIDHFDLDETVKTELLWQAKKEYLQLPNSMFLNNKAMELIELESENYQFELISYPFDEIKHSAPLWLQNILENDDNAKLLLCYDSQHRIVGATLFMEIIHGNDGFVYINYQRATKQTPGAGLMMLKYVIDLYRHNKAFSKVALLTALIPRGLGNLGFVPSDEQPNLMWDSIGYECPLREMKE